MSRELRLGPFPFWSDEMHPHLQNGNMGSRHKMSKAHSKRNFTKKALNTKHQNFVSGVMRGGIRF